MKKSNKERFFTFLRQYRAYSHYLKAFEDWQDGSINDLITEEDADDYIVRAFAWYKTKQGSEYWLNLCDLWRKEIRK